MAELLHHVMRAGPDAPVLLLIHPLGANLHFWEECIPIWHGRIASLACDLRSSGRSPRAREPVTVARHVADLEALRQALGLDAVVPVGCAIGAMVAAAYAARHPERVSALVLSNPAPRTSEQAAAMLRQRAERVRRGGMSAIVPGAVDRAFVEQPRDERFQRYLARFAAQDAEAYPSPYSASWRRTSLPISKQSAVRRWLWREATTCSCRPSKRRKSTPCSRTRSSCFWRTPRTSPPTRRQSNSPGSFSTS